MIVTSLFFVSSSLFPVERIHISLLPVAILFMTQCFVLLSVLLPLSFSSRFFPSLLLSSLLSFSVFLRHSGTSPSMVRCLSRPPPFPLKSSIFLVSSLLLFLLFSHACWKATVNFHELVSASSFTRASCVTVVSLQWDCLLTTHDQHVHLWFLHFYFRIFFHVKDFPCSWFFHWIACTCHLQLNSRFARTCPWFLQLSLRNCRVSHRSFSVVHQLLLNNFPFFIGFPWVIFHFCIWSFECIHCVSSQVHRVVTWFQYLSSFSFLELPFFFLSVFLCFLCVHRFMRFHSTQPSQGHYNRSVHSNVVFFNCFLFLQHFSLIHEVHHVSWNRCSSLNCFRYCFWTRPIDRRCMSVRTRTRHEEIVSARCFLLHLTIVFPLIVFT